MPYINQEDRFNIHLTKEQGNDFEAIVVDELETAGDLQYAMAVLFKSYIERKGLRYQQCNDIMGALAGAQMEFYRKVVGPYESKKESENGGVY